MSRKTIWNRINRFWVWLALSAAVVIAPRAGSPQGAYSHRYGNLRRTAINSHV